jgi:hypothetical protein
MIEYTHMLPRFYLMIPKSEHQAARAVVSAASRIVDVVPHFKPATIVEGLQY